MIKDLCFEIIQKCPNECIFCSSLASINKVTIIRFDTFKKTLDYILSKGGVEELSFSGGEPFLNPDLFKMIEYAKSKGIRVVLFTSGIKYSNLLSLQERIYYQKKRDLKLKEIREHEPWNDRLLRNVSLFYERLLTPKTFSCISKEDMFRLRSLGLDKIVFDFQGYEEETATLLMGRRNELQIMMYDSILNASFVGLDIDIHFIPMKPNQYEIGDILELLEIAKIPNISILKFVPQGRGRIRRKDLELTDEELKSFLERLKEVSSFYSGNIRIGIPLQIHNEHKCTAGIEKLDIKFDGTILPCPAFKELTKEEAKKYGIRLYHIDEDLKDLKISGSGSRVEPLCRKVYKKD